MGGDGARHPLRHIFLCYFVTFHCLAACPSTPHRKMILPFCYSFAASVRVLSIMSHNSMCALRLPAACARSPGSLDVAMFDTSRESSAIMSCKISMTARKAAGDDSRWKARAAFMSKSSGFLYMSLRTCLRRRHVFNSIMFGLVFEGNLHAFFFLVQMCAFSSLSAEMTNGAHSMQHRPSCGSL